jgi:fimbrial chaperone protein
MSEINKPVKRKLHLVVRTPLFLVACGIIGLACTFLTPGPGFAANFSVSPSSLELSGSVKSGVFSVINSGKEKLNCQLDVKEWSQDAAGKDIYTDTKDIVFFPKIMTVKPNDQRAVRLGIKGPPSKRERTYRFFVEEIPSQNKGQDGANAGKITAGLTIAFRYAVPIFVRPVTRKESGVIESIEMSKGAVRATVKNTGNIRIKLLTVKFRGKAINGKELFSKDIPGWYVLHGHSRPYEAIVPKEVCKNVATIDVNAPAENITLNGTLNVQKNMCE